jgi:hypothetical protein
MGMFFDRQTVLNELELERAKKEKAQRTLQNEALHEVFSQGEQDFSNLGFRHFHFQNLGDKVRIARGAAWCEITADSGDNDSEVVFLVRLEEPEGDFIVFPNPTRLTKEEMLDMVLAWARRVQGNA